MQKKKKKNFDTQNFNKSQLDKRLKSATNSD